MSISRYPDEMMWAVFAAAGVVAAGDRVVGYEDQVAVGAGRFADRMLKQHRDRFPLESSVSDLDMHELEQSTIDVRLRSIIERLRNMRAGARR